MTGLPADPVVGCQTVHDDLGPPHGERVVVLHGLARTRRSMAPLARRLAAAGYRVRNVGYPSRHHPVAVLAEAALAAGRAADAWHGGILHVVTHSLGGILLRQYLRAHELPQLGRVVMLAPPNQGSEVVDALSDRWFFRWFNGPAGQELATGAEGLPGRLGPARFELGVIAGERCCDPIIGRYVPEPSDGKVSVASTRLEGMRDHLTLPLSHTLIMRSPVVARQTLHFLAHGHFQREGDTQASARP